MPYPWSQAVIAYEVDCTNADPAVMRARMQAIPLFFGEQAKIGFTVVNDQTTIVAVTRVRRELTLALSPQFNQNVQPSADPTVFFQNLYSATIAQGLGGVSVDTIVAAPPNVI